MKPRVIVVPHFREMDEIFDAATWERLEAIADVRWGRDGPMPGDLFADELDEATAVVFGTWHYGRNAIARARPSLKHVFEVAGGHSHRELDYTTCLDRGITVGSCAPAFGPVVAEMALAMTLAAARLVVVGDAAFRRGEERWLHDGNAGARSLYGRTVGFLGAGGLSRALQHLLEPFAPRLLGYDPWLDDEVLRERAIEPVGLEALFDRSEVVFVLAVPSPQNRGIVSRKLMERLDPADVLVVMSRAHLVEFDALTDLVLQGRFRAAIDVFPAEPLDRSHPIRRAAGVVLSAHRAGALPEALLEIGRMVVDDLESLLAGRPPSRMQYATPELAAGLGLM